MTPKQPADLDTALVHLDRFARRFRGELRIIVARGRVEVTLEGRHEHTDYFTLTPDMKGWPV